MKYHKTILLMTSVFIASCADIEKAGSEFLEAKADAPTFALTNLHPSTVTNKMYTTNYIQEGMIPRCSEIRVIKNSGRDTLKFEYNNVDYVYKLDGRTTPEGWDVNTRKYFGPGCDVNAVKKLSSIDQQGIAEGKALIGMSKQGVVYAIGYPPEHATPNLNTANSWKYWMTPQFQHMTFTVKFDAAGKVAQVQMPPEKSFW